MPLCIWLKAGFALSPDISNLGPETPQGLPLLGLTYIGGKVLSISCKLAGPAWAIAAGAAAKNPGCKIAIENGVILTHTLVRLTHCPTYR